MTSEEVSTSEAVEYSGYLAKDGRYYATYEEMREANVRMNEARLQKIGLLNFVEQTHKQQRRKPKNRKTKAAALATAATEASSFTTEQPQPTRRSDRKRVVRTIPNIAPPPVVKKKKKANVKQRKKMKDDWNTPALQAFRKQYESQAQADTTWFTAFQEYWHGKLSAQNCKCSCVGGFWNMLPLAHQTRLKPRSLFLFGLFSLQTPFLFLCTHLKDKTIVRQCTKLVEGQGITYHHWPAEVCFCPNTKINMSADFDALYQLAIQYETQYGADLGHGMFVCLWTKAHRAILFG
jgi:hypothetical protein